MYKRYKALADESDEVTFLGRLGTYKYYNMDQVVGQALALYQRLVDAQTVTVSEPAPGESAEQPVRG